MRLVIDAASPSAPYEQIQAQIADRAATGELAGGSRLPTVRRLAADLGLAVNTVARAYRELEQAGVILTRGRLGTFVCDEDETTASAREAAEAFARRAQTLGLDVRSAVALVRAAWDAAS